MTGDNAKRQGRTNFIQKTMSRQDTYNYNKKLQDEEARREANMEAPKIVKSIHRGITSMSEDAWNQAVGKTPQTMSNRQAFDVVYPDHKSFYADKQFFIFDRNYEKMQKALVHTFEKAVDDSLNKGHTKLFESVDQFGDAKINVDFGGVPKVKYLF